MFHPDRVIDVKAREKSEVLKELADVLATSPDVTNRDELLAKIIEREKTMSTGVGVGLAIPHVKIGSVKDFVIAIGRSSDGIEFQSIDNQPAHIFVMIGCNQSQSADYMKVLSKIVRSLKEKSFQDKLMQAESGQEVVDLFVGPGGSFA